MEIHVLSKQIFCALISNNRLQSLISDVTYQCFVYLQTWKIYNYFLYSAKEMSKLNSVLYFPALILLSSNIYFHLPSNLRFYDHNSFFLGKNNSQWIITDLRIILSYLKFSSRSLGVRQKFRLSWFLGLTNIW